MDVSESVIDPALLEEASENDRLGPTTDGAIASLSTATSPRPPCPPPAPRTHRFSKEDIESSSASSYAPRRDANESRAEYEQRLMLVTRKAPLSEPCSKLSIKVPKTATLEMLRNELAKYWFTQASSRPTATSQTHATSVPSRQHPDNTLNFAEPLHFAPPRGILPTVSSTARGEFRGTIPCRDLYRRIKTLSPHYGVRPACASSAFHLTRKMRRNTRKKKMATPMNWIKQYGVEGANAEELLGYDDEDDEGGGDDEDEEVAASDDEEAAAGDEEAAHTAFKQTTRVQAVRRAEENRRIGGIRTQKAVVKDFNEWQTMALKQGEIKDKIIDEHAILHYIEYSAEHEKKTRRGVPIPGSRLGASQLKKLFFGVLRIRKPQDAADPGLAQRRPATTFIVWEALKNWMDEPLQRVRNGLDEAHDALDIRANTLLAECVLWCLVISHGALSNRGDDFRALKLAELQPYGMTHLDGRTSVFTVLGLQGEEKAGKRGMRTVTNPSYSAFVTNKNPERRSSKLTGLSIRASAKAFVCAGFSSHMKAHLPRHLLGYKQEKMGFDSVDKADTSKLGWVRGATYFDTHAPALPKKVKHFCLAELALTSAQAILGAARFKVEETYDPVWTRVHVPQQFLELICPKAESIRDEIANRANLSGAFNYWQMVIDLRPYAFQCGAAIFQKCPKSALFRLPAFCDTDFRTWMQSTFPSELSLLQVKEGSPADLLLIQNAVLRKALEDLYKLANIGDAKLTKLTELFERRTAVLSPAQGFSIGSYHRNALAFSSSPSTPPRTSSTPSAPIFLHFDEQMEETGTYESSDADGTTSIRAFVNGSPRSPDEPRAPTQVDLVLPPTEAFYKPGGSRGIVPPLFGQKSARNPNFAGLCGGRSPSTAIPLGKKSGTSWIDGEAVYNGAGIQTGKKPPLNLVEQYLQNKWRTPDDHKERGIVAQHWGRYREIPEWIEREWSRRTVSPSVVVTELEAMRVVGDQTKGMNWLRQEVATLRKQAAQPVDGAGTSTSSVVSTTSTPPLPASESIQSQNLGALAPACEEDLTKRKRAPAADSRRTKKRKKLI
ncbi:hypothetical protein B0H13DRAFT_1914590 [Mycena leptocephala]|nr:hypothetical protein B0H13DRAFT_1914590 [Mycena leptocephala]